MQTATNPQTGERIQWNGSAWVPLTGEPQAAPAAQAPSGPITLGTPRPEKPVIRQVGDSLGIVNPQTGEFTPTYTAPQKMTATGSGSKITAKVREDAIQAYTDASSLEALADRLEQQYRAGPGSTSGIAGLQDYLPTSTNRQFNDTSSQARGLVKRGLGFTGGEGNTIGEIQLNYGPYLPEASDYDGQIENKIASLRQLAANSRKRAISVLGGEPDVNGVVTPVSEQPQAAPEAPAQDTGAVVHDANLGGEQIAVSTNGYRTVDNPELAGVRGEYLRRLDAGEGAGSIIPWLRQAGVTDPKIMRSVIEQIQFRKANPNVPVEKYNTSQLDDMDVPLSSTEAGMNNLAQSAGGAYAMRAGNAVTLNNLDSIVGATGGNAERARIGLEDASRNHPIAGLAGDISGGVMGALGAEAGLGATGMGAGFGRALTADALYGAGAGAGAADGEDRFMGAVRGGLAGLAGSLGGQAVVKGAGAVVSPTGGRLADLYDAGVRPTPGQRFVNANDGKGIAGTAGRVLNATEEALGSVPIIGGAIRGARQDARDQFQVGAFNQALQEIGEKLPKGMKPGGGAHRYANEKIGKVYDKAREGMVVAADEQLASEIGQLGDEAGMLAEPSIRRFESIVRNVLIRRTGDVIDGAAYKQIQSELGKVIRGIRKNQSGDGELANVLEGLQGALDGAARRHSSPEAVAALDAADRAYAKLVRIEAASARGGAAKDAGTFSPNDLASSVKANDNRVRSKGYNEGSALMQDYAEAGKSLSDRMPNSGTADRLWTGGAAAGAAGYVEPSTLGVLGVLGALYAPGVRKVVGGAMAPRGPKARAIADQVRKRGRIAGHAAGSQAALNSGS